MATVLGAGTALAAAWLLDPTRFAPSTPPLEEPARVTPEPDAPVDSPATLDALARTVWVLEGNHVGLTLTELRLMLSEPTESLQRAIAAGLRTKQLRRLGSRNKLRYVRNG